jgi:1-acyl-sn-glycerol-3-phosphate acyltransferase
MAHTPLSAEDLDRLINQPPRVAKLRNAIFAAANGLSPAVDLSRIYVDGLENLPGDGRFLLVGNHTSAGWPEILVTGYFVHRHLGVRLRGLAIDKVKEMTGLRRDLAEAVGAVPGQPDVAAELMQRGQALLVYPGGGRDMLKFKGEEYRLMWKGRSGFARLAVAHDYPIVPVGLVGGDDVFQSLVERNSTWERMTRSIGERLHGLSGTGIPLMRGLGLTMLPRPQRMYLRFGQPISTTRPAGAGADTWEATVKQRTQSALEAILADLQELRTGDPYRNLNPLAWGAALQPS